MKADQRAPPRSCTTSVASKHTTPGQKRPKCNTRKGSSLSKPSRDANQFPTPSTNKCRCQNSHYCQISAPLHTAAPLHTKTNTLPVRNPGSREKITAPRHSPVLNTNTHTSICRRQQHHLPRNNNKKKFFAVNAKVSNSCIQILGQTHQKRERRH
jgi:hypothetical protein